MTARYLLITNFKDNQARIDAYAVFGRFSPVQLEENVIVLREPGQSEDMKNALAEANAKGWFHSYALVEMPYPDVVRAFTGDGSYAAAFGAGWRP